ncbi:unnamed protein product [Caenorhabditis brenneri]
MATQLILTEEIINCFGKCIEARNYRQLFENHKEFFESLVENLKKTEFHRDELCRIITQNAQTFFDFLYNWKLEYSETEKSFQEIVVPEFLLELYEAVFFMNWETFYIKYRPEADFIISQARIQNTMDFRIEFKSVLYENFVSRDLAVRNENASSAYFKRNPSFNTSNDILKDFMEQKFRAMEFKIEKSMEKKLTEFFKSVLDDEIDSLVGLEPKIDSSMERKLNEFFKQREEALDSKIEKSVDKKMNEILKSREQILEDKISSLEAQVEELKNHQKLVASQFDQRLQFLESSMMAILTELSKHFEGKLQNVTEDMEEIIKLLEAKLGNDLKRSNAEIKLQAEQLLLETLENTNDLRLAIEKMASDIEALDWKCTLLTRDVERLTEETSSDSLEDSDDSTHSENDFGAQDHGEHEINAQGEDAREESFDNDSIRQIEEEFQRNLAAQVQIYEEKLKMVREQREKMNREAEKERNQILERLKSLCSKK